MPTQLLLQDVLASIDRAALSEPPPELQRYARKEAIHPGEGPDRRRDRRFSLITNVIAVPVDCGLRKTADPFVALSSGMSVSGIRLIHTQPSPADFLLIELQYQPVRFVLNVLRNQACGHCYEIAGTFRWPEVAAQNAGAPAVLTAGSVIRSAEDGPAIVEEFPPTAEVLELWAGVAAAVQLLNSDCNAKPRGRVAVSR